MTVDRRPELAAEARQNLNRQRIGHVTVHSSNVVAQFAAHVAAGRADS